MKNSILENKSSKAFVMLFALMLTMNQTAFSQYICQPSGTPTTTTGSLTTTDATQNGRVFRNGIPTGCGGGAPTEAPLTGTYRADVLPFTSPVTGCATVDMDFTGCGAAATNSTQAVAYSNYNPASVGTGILGHPGFSTVSTGSFSFPVTAGQNFSVVVSEVFANAGCPTYSIRLSYNTSCAQAGFDRTNDGKADPAIWTPATGTWNIFNSAGGLNTVQFGQTGDIPTAGDYTGDGQTDVSVYRPSNNTWYIGLSQTTPNTVFSGRAFGTTGDIPVPGDYDRDGRNDIAVWRPSNGIWYALRSSDNTLFAIPWGQNGDTPVVGDFDGDRIIDPGVTRTINGVLHWFIIYSNFNYTQTYPNVNGATGFVRFGLPTDIRVPGDYDGDRKTDVAVFRPSNGTWYYIRSNNLTSTNQSSVAFQFGQNGDIPQPADYDGDGKTDFAVVRPNATQNTWFINNSGTNTNIGYAIGTSTDQPVTSPYRVQLP
jgi:hypothetical protein